MENIKIAQDKFKELIQGEYERIDRMKQAVCVVEELAKEEIAAEH